MQSSSGNLHLQLSQVPKMLGTLRSAWAPGAFVVSFKLETDDSILGDKATGAMQKYGMHAVVANLLATRFKQVRLFSGPSSCPTSEDITLSPDAKDIEQQIVGRLVDMHRTHGQNVNTSS